MSRTNNNNEREGEEEEEEPAEPTVSCWSRFKTGTAMKCHNFGIFMWNSEDKTCMGRRPLNWCAVLGYYLLFYAVLAAFWAACMAGFLRTIDRGQPTMQGNYSMLKANPGMTYEPMPATDNTLLKVTANNTIYIDRMAEILKPYHTAYEALNFYRNQSKIMAVCDDNSKNSAHGYACVTDISQIPDECSQANDYGLSSGAPCVFLRPNKIYGFMPLPYWNITVETAKEDPAPPASLLNNYDPHHIGVTCEGENDGDRDNLLNVTFYPADGFPFHYYPYYNQPDYLPPFVLARFRVVPGNVVMIWCRIWAQNIKHDKNDRQGSIHFELLVDV